MTEWPAFDDVDPIESEDDVSPWYIDNEIEDSDD